MWQGAIQVGVSEVVAAPPERVWSLLSSAAAWSARRESFSFDIPVPSDAGNPLRFCLDATPGDVAVTLHEVSNTDGNHLIRLQSLHRQASWELSVEPNRHGSRIWLTTSAVVERGIRVSYEADERSRLKAWARNLRAICETRQPWPDGSMPEGIRKACLLDRSDRYPRASASSVARLVPEPVIEVTAQARIGRPADAVWRVLATPPIVQAVSPGLLHYGLLPGSPATGVGRMTYRISRYADRLRATASVTSEQQDDVMVVRNLASPYSPARFRVQPDGPGSTLSVEFRCHNRARVQTAAEHRAAHQEQIDRLALAYKTAIEEAVPPPAVS